MSQLIGILFSDFGPYHASRIEQLHKSISPEDKLIAFRFSEFSNTYSWQPVLPSNVEVITLASKAPLRIKDAGKIALRFKKMLRKKKITSVFLPSYSPITSFLCFLAAKLAGCKTILMCDSWHGTEKANWLGRLLKRIIIRNFNAALVAGIPHVEYVCSYGIDPKKVFTGYDVVDNCYFKNKANYYRSDFSKQIDFLKLPPRFFLNLGRFVKNKNLAILVKAYTNLIRHNPEVNIALVFVGEGEEEAELKRIGVELGIHIRDGLSLKEENKSRQEIVFYPFQQYEIIPLFFSRCEAFVLPSLYEEWGLVINEAMACGKAVIVSENVGCVKDLVHEGKNGFVFDPKSVDQLEAILQKFIAYPELSHTLGNQGLTYIQEWGLKRFSMGAIKALKQI